VLTKDPEERADEGLIETCASCEPKAEDRCDDADDHDVCPQDEGKDGACDIETGATLRAWDGGRVGDMLRDICAELALSISDEGRGGERLRNCDGRPREGGAAYCVGRGNNNVSCGCGTGETLRASDVRPLAGSASGCRAGWLGCGRLGCCGGTTIGWLEMGDTAVGETKLQVLWPLTALCGLCT
jgi:hypothetical protein